MKTTKKILAVVLSVMLLLSVMPFAAFAATTDVTDDLATAVANAAAGDTLSLTQDVEVTSITIDKALTIDLNGHTITTSAPSYSAAVFVITSTGDLTIKSTGASTLKTSDAEGTVTYTAGKVQTSKRVVMNSGIFTLASGILEGDDIVAVKSNSTTTIKGGWCKGYDGAIFAGQNVTGATINVKGGAITSEDNACVMTNGTSNCYGNTVNISSGKMYARMSQASVQNGYMAMAIYHPSNNTLNISGGTMKAFDGAGVVIRGGDVNISGGTIIATGDKTGKCGDANAPLVVSSAIVVDTQCNYPSSATVDVDITNGTFNSDIAVISTYDEGAATDADAAITITGGTFKANGVAADVSEYIDTAADKVVDANGKVVDALFEVNGVKYAHITEAVAAVPADGTQTTIKLLKDVSDSGYGGAVVQAGQNIIFDLDNHTWTLRGTVGSTGTKTNGFQFLQGSTVKIKDGTITAKLASIYTVIQNYGDLTIENATVQYTSSGANKTTVSTNSGNVVIKNSTITGPASTSSFQNQALSVTPGWGGYTDTSIVVEDTTINGDVRVDAQAEGSTADVEFTGTTNMTRGEIKLSDTANGTLDVKNTGTDITAPEGYKWDEDGILTELQDTTVAVIGSTEYATLEEAIAAAQAGDTVKLVADVDFTVYPAFTRHTLDLTGVTLDLDGHTITGYNHSVVYVGDNFTIKNGNMVCVYDSVNNKKESYAAVIYPQVGNWQTDVVTDKSTGVVLENLVLTGGINCFGADVTVRGENTNVTGNYYYALWADVLATLTVEDGTFTSAASSTNGIIGACSDAGKEAYVYISGGDYTVPAGKNLVLQSTMASSQQLVEISGGTYNVVVPAKACAEGFVPVTEPNEEGKYIVEPFKANNAANLALEGIIEENIYMDADAYNLGDDAVIKVTYNASTNISETAQEVTDVYNVKDLTPFDDPKDEFDGTYKFAFKQAPAQITEDVTVALYADENAQEPVKTITYSTKDYCDNVIATSNNAKLVALCKSILDYGAAAQLQFNYNTDNMAVDTFYNAAAIEALTYSDITGTYLSDEIGIKGCAFQCLANTNINLYFDEPLTSKNIIALVDGDDESTIKANYMISETDGLFVSVNSIEAGNMTKNFTIITSNGSVTTNLNTIVKTCLYYGTATTLAKTIYFYADAANTYFN